MGAQPPAQPLAQPPVRQQAPDRGRHGRGIFVRNKQARFAIAYLLAGAVVGGCDHRQPGRARLGDDMGHPLAA